MGWNIQTVCYGQSEKGEEQVSGLWQRLGCLDLELEKNLTGRGWGQKWKNKMEEEQILGGLQNHLGREEEVCSEGQHWNREREENLVSVSQRNPHKDYQVNIKPKVSKCSGGMTSFFHVNSAVRIVLFLPQNFSTLAQTWQSCHQRSIQGNTELLW